MEFEEILFRAKQGDEMAIKQVLEMFQPMLVRNALVNGWLDEDLYQELVIEVLKCIRHFRKMK